MKRNQSSFPDDVKKVPDLKVNPDMVEAETETAYERGRGYVDARDQLPEKQLFAFAEYHAQDAERTGNSEYSYWKSVWRNFIKKRSAVVMLCIFFFLCIFTLIVPAFSKYNANAEYGQKGYSAIDSNMQLRSPIEIKESKALKDSNYVHIYGDSDKEVFDCMLYDSDTLAQKVLKVVKGSSPFYMLNRVYFNTEYWFGTNQRGQDYWSQVWQATKTSIVLSVSVSIGQILLGVIIGLVWGYVRSLDRFFTELYNFIDNIPTIIYMTLVALMIGKSTLIMGIAMILFFWLGTARNVRNLVLMYRDREYNLASRCLGTGTARILAKNIFPYLISVIVLRLALSIPQIIAYETTLNYLGLLPVTTVSLGQLLKYARNLFLENPHTMIFPAAIVSMITITFYIAGNAFSDACDPRNHV
ncbi:MAG: ABC transporter permease [Clostridiales bacterium]|nr:ABC transporter permease [Clostridiales bacterium]